MSWEGLLGILNEQRDIIAKERDKRPEACPYDGTPLQEAGGGVLHCPFDGYQYPRDGFRL